MATKDQLVQGDQINDMVGMPIYTLDNGRKLGAVKHVVFNSQQNRLMGFTLERRGLFSSKLWVLPIEHVKSIGRDAVMIENSNAFVTEREAPAISRAVKSERGLGHKAVVTQSGNYLGRIADVIVDDTTKETVSYEVSQGMAQDVKRGRAFLESSSASKFGIDAVIVPDYVETTIQEQEPGGLTGAYRKGREAAGQAAESATTYTQEKEISMSRGKVAGRNVYDNDGYLIVAKDETINDSIIEQAVNKGKMHDVAMAAGVGAIPTERIRTGTQSTWDRLSRGWDNLVDTGRNASSEASRKRAIAAQKKFLTGKFAANDVPGMNGEILLHQDEVITPLVLDTLDRSGTLEMVKVKPVPEGAVEAGSALHVVVEEPQTHKEHAFRTHI